jgi:hypothetical protein
MRVRIMTSPSPTMRIPMTRHDRSNRYYQNNLPSGQPDFSQANAISTGTATGGNGIVDMALGLDGYLYMVDAAGECGPETLIWHRYVPSYRLKRLSSQVTGSCGCSSPPTTALGAGVRSSTATLASTSVSRSRALRCPTGMPPPGQDVHFKCLYLIVASSPSLRPNLQLRISW